MPSMANSGIYFIAIWYETVIALPSSCIHEMYLWTDSREIRTQDNMCCQYIAVSRKDIENCRCSSHHSCHGKVLSTLLFLYKTIVGEGRENLKDQCIGFSGI